MQHRYTELIAINGIRLVSVFNVRQSLQERSKPSIDKTSEHDSSIYYGNLCYFLVLFFSHVTFEFQAFYTTFLPIFPAMSTESSKIYFIFLISVFAIFYRRNLNVCHRNFDVNKNSFRDFKY